MSHPLFSIVVPSRNRQNLLAYTLQSLKMQNFDDFEVIVSDNSDDHSIATKLVNELGDPRFKIVHTPRILKMHESYNFAISHASGKYVTVLSNRVMLLPGALSKVALTLREVESAGEIDIINWMVDWFSFDDEKSSESGRYQMQHDLRRPKIFDSINELKYRLNFSTQIGKGVRCFRGQIYYGFFSRNLLQKIKERVGEIFCEISPDYVALALGLLNSRRSCDVGMPLALMISSSASTGMQNAAKSENMRNFLFECFPQKTIEEISDFMPIKGIYNSLCNHVAYDYLNAISRSKENHLLSFLNYGNLLLRAIEDSKNNDKNLFDEIGWPSKNRLKILKLKNSLSKSYYHIKDGFWLDKMLFKISKKISCRGFCLDRKKQNSTKPTQVFVDPIAALKYGHEHYKSLSSLRYN